MPNYLRFLQPRELDELDQQRESSSIYGRVQNAVRSSDRDVSSSRYTTGFRPLGEDDFITMLDGRPRLRSDVAQLPGGETLLDLIDKNQRGERGFVEAYTDINRLKGDLPLVGDVFGVVMPISDILRVRNIAKDLEAEKPVSDSDMVLVQTFLEDQKRMSQTSTMGMVGDIARALPLFAADIWVNVKLGGAIGSMAGAQGGVIGAAAGGAKALSTGAKNATRYVAKKALSEGIQRRLGKFLATTAGKQIARRATKFGEGIAKGAIAGTAIAAVDTAINAAANTAAGRSPFMSRGAAERYAGAALVGEDMSLGMAQMMGMGDRWIEYMSEMSGEAFQAFLPSGGSFKLLNKAFDRVFGDTTTRAAQATAVAGGTASRAVRAKVAALGALSFIGDRLAKDGDMEAMLKRMSLGVYDGYVEEILEERYGDYVRGLLGIQGTGAGFSNALREAIPERKQLAAEMIGFAIPMVGAVAIRRGQLATRGITGGQSEEWLRNTLKASQVAASETVELSDAGGLKNARGVDMGTVDSGVDGISGLASMERAHARSPMAKVASTFLDAASLVMTGHLSGLSQLAGADVTFSTYGRPALVGAHNSVFRAAREQLKANNPAATDEELDAGAEAEARAVTTETLERLRKTFVVQRNILQRLNISDEEYQKLSEDPEALVAKLREAVDKKILRPVSYDNGKMRFWTLAEANVDPIAKAMGTFNDVISEVLVRHGYPAHVTKVSSLEEGQQQAFSIHGRRSMTVTDQDLDAFIENPMSTRGSMLAGLNRQYGLHIKERAAAFRAWAKRVKALKQAGAFGHVYTLTDGEGNVQQRLKVTVLPNGRVKITPAATYTGRGFEYDQKVVTDSRFEAANIQHQIDSMDDAAAARAVPNILKELGFSEPAAEDIVFHQREVIESEDPRLMAALAYGFMGKAQVEEKDPVVAAKLKARAEKFLIETYGPSAKTDAGTFALDFGNLNSTDDVILQANLDSHHMTEELLERAIKVDNEDRRTMPSQYDSRVLHFLNAFSKALGVNFKNLDKTLVTSLRRMIASSPSDAAAKIFSALFLDSGMYNLQYGLMPTPYMEQIRSVVGLIAGHESLRPFVEYMAEVSGIKPEGSAAINKAVFNQYADAFTPEAKLPVLHKVLNDALSGKLEAPEKPAAKEGDMPRPTAAAKKPAPAKKASPPAANRPPPMDGISTEDLNTLFGVPGLNLDEQKKKPKPPPAPPPPASPPSTPPPSPPPAAAAEKSPPKANQRTLTSKKMKSLLEKRKKPPSATPSIIPIARDQDWASAFSAAENIGSAANPPQAIIEESLQRAAKEQNWSDAEYVAALGGFRHWLQAREPATQTAAEAAQPALREILDLVVENHDDVLSPAEWKLLQRVETSTFMRYVVPLLNQVSNSDGLFDVLQDDASEDDQNSDVDSNVLANGDQRTLRALSQMSYLSNALEFLTGMAGPQALFALTHDPAVRKSLGDALVSADAFETWLDQVEEDNAPIYLTGLKLLIKTVNTAVMGAEETTQKSIPGLSASYLKGFYETFRCMMQTTGGIFENGEFVVRNGTSTATALTTRANARVEYFAQNPAALYSQVAAPFQEFRKKLHQQKYLESLAFMNMPISQVQAGLKADPELAKLAARLLGSWTGAGTTFFSNLLATEAGLYAVAKMLAVNMNFQFAENKPQQFGIPVMPPTTEEKREAWFKNFREKVSAAMGATWTSIAKTKGSLADVIPEEDFDYLTSNEFTKQAVNEADALPHLISMARLSPWLENGMLPGFDAARVRQAGWLQDSKLSKLLNLFLKDFGVEGWNQSYFSKLFPDAVDPSNVYTLAAYKLANGNEVAFEDLEVSEKMRAIDDMERRGFLYLGVFGDKTNKMFLRVRDLNPREALEAYRKWYGMQDRLLIEQASLTPLSAVEATFRQWERETSRTEKARLGQLVSRPLLIGRLNEMLDGRLRFYLQPGLPEFATKTLSDLKGTEYVGPDGNVTEKTRKELREFSSRMLDNRFKRRGNDPTGGRDGENLERYLPDRNGDRRPRVLMLDIGALSDNLDGMVLHREATMGKAAVEAFGSKFAGDEEAAWSLKFQVSYVNEQGIPYLDKLHSVGVEQLSEGRPIMAKLRKLMEDADVDVLVIEASEKVPSKTAYKYGFVPAADRLEADSVDNLPTAEQALQHVRQVEGKNFTFPLALHGSNTARSARFAKQLQNIIASLPNANEYYGLLDEALDAALQVFNPADIRQLTQVAIKQLESGDDFSQRLAAGLRAGTYTITSAAIRSRVRLIPAVLRALQFSTPRVRGPLVMAPEGKEATRLRTGNGQYLVNMNARGRNVFHRVKLNGDTLDEAKRDFVKRFHEEYRRMHGGQDIVSAIDNFESDLGMFAVQPRAIPMWHVFRLNRVERPAGPMELGDILRDDGRYISAASPVVLLDEYGNVDPDCLKNEMFEQVDGAWVVNGTAVLGDRIPADGLQSMRAAFLGDGFPNANANLIEQDPWFVGNAGVDGDGDTPNIWFATGDVGTSLEGIRSRFMMMLIDDYLSNPAIGQWANRSISPITDLDKRVGDDIKFAENTPIPTVPEGNSLARTEYELRVGQVGKNTVGVAAKMNVTLRQFSGMGGYLTRPVVIPDLLNVSRTQAEAQKILDDVDTWHRMNLALYVSAQREISGSVDDSKNLYKGHEKLWAWRLGLSIAATYFDHDILFPQGLEGKRYDHEAELPAALAAAERILRAVATNKFLDAVDEYMDPGVKRLTDPDFRRRGAAKAAFKLLTKNLLQKTITKVDTYVISRAEWYAFQDVLNEQAKTGKGDRTVEEMAEAYIGAGLVQNAKWLQLHYLAEALRILGRETDVLVGAPRVRTLEDVQLLIDGHKALIAQKAGPFALANTDRLKTSGKLLQALYDAAPVAFASALPAGRPAVSKLLDEGKQNPSIKVNSIMGYIKTQLAVRQMMDQWKEQHPEDPLQLWFTVSRINSLRDQYPGNRFLSIIAPAGSRMLLGGIQLAPIYVGVNGAQLSEAVQMQARIDFDKLPGKLQLEIAVAAASLFDFATGPRNSSFTQLMGDPARSTFLRTLATAENGVEERWRQEDPYSLTETVLEAYRITPTFKARALLSKGILNHPYQSDVGKKTREPGEQQLEEWGRVLVGDSVARLAEPTQEGQEAVPPRSGFLGFKGGFDHKGRGSAQGDGKDKEMRRVANAFVGEIVNPKTKTSTFTSAAEIAAKHKGYTPQISDKMTFSGPTKRGAHTMRVSPAALANQPIVVMLARNGSLKNMPLLQETEEYIRGFAKQENVRFVVGDMPFVDSPFVTFLQSIGATFEIYHPGKAPRLTSENTPGMPTEAPEAPAAPPSTGALDNIPAGETSIDDINITGLATPSITSGAGFEAFSRTRGEIVAGLEKTVAAMPGVRPESFVRDASGQLVAVAQEVHLEGPLTDMVARMNARYDGSGEDASSVARDLFDGISGPDAPMYKKVSGIAVYTTDLSHVQPGMSPDEVLFRAYVRPDPVSGDRPVFNIEKHLPTLFILGQEVTDELLNRLPYVRVQQGGDFAQGYPRDERASTNYHREIRDTPDFGSEASFEPGWQFDDVDWTKQVRLPPFIDPSLRLRKGTFGDLKKLIIDQHALIAHTEAEQNIEATLGLDGILGVTRGSMVSLGMQIRDTLDRLAASGESQDPGEFVLREMRTLESTLWGNTIVTDALEKLARRVQAVRKLIDTDRPTDLPTIIEDIQELGREALLDVAEYIPLPPAQKTPESTFVPEYSYFGFKRNESLSEGRRNATPETEFTFDLRGGQFSVDAVRQALSKELQDKVGYAPPRLIHIVNTSDGHDRYVYYMTQAQGFKALMESGTPEMYTEYVPVVLMAAWDPETLVGAAKAGLPSRPVGDRANSAYSQYDDIQITGLPTPSIMPVVTGNTIALHFTWRDKLFALPERIKRQQTLAQQLTKIKAPKDEAAAFLQWAKGKTGDSAELLSQYEVEVLPKLEIKLRLSMEQYVADQNEMRARDALDQQDEYDRLVAAGRTWEAEEMALGAEEDRAADGPDLPPEWDVMAPRSPFAYGSLSVNKERGNYAEYFIRTPFPVPGQHGIFKDPNLAGWFRVREHTEPEVLEVQEIQSELFQKNKGGFEANVRKQRFDSSEAAFFGGDTGAFEFTPEQATFLNLMLKDQTWVPVFVNAITQWARNQGFERVRFPTGETAAKVEGHQVLADRLAALQEERAAAESGAPVGRVPPMPLEGEEIDLDYLAGEAMRGTPTRSIEAIDAEIQNLKTQGIEKLAPIEAFYEKRVASIVNKMGAKPVTDANGNTWREVTVEAATPSVQAPVDRRSLPERAASPALLLNWLSYRRSDALTETPFERGRLQKETNAVWAPYLRDFAAKKTYVEAHDYVEWLKTQKIYAMDDNIKHALDRWAELHLPAGTDSKTLMNTVLGADTAPSYEQMTFDLDVKPRETPSVMPVIDTVDGWYSPSRGGGAAFLTSTLVNEAQFAMGERDAVRRWFVNQVQEWGLDGLIRKYEEHTFERDETGAKAPYTKTGLKMWWSSTNAPKLTKDQRLAISLLHFAAFQGLEYTEERPGQHRKLHPSTDFNIILGIPIKAGVDALATMLPRSLAEKLHDRARQVIESVGPAPEPTRDAHGQIIRTPTTEQVRDYERKVARALYMANVARFQLRSKGTNLSENAMASDTWYPRNVSYILSASDVRQALRTGEPGEASAFDRLVEAKRDPARLNLETLVNEAAEHLDGMHRRLTSRIPWIMRRDSLFLKYQHGYSSHYFGNGYLGPNEKEAQRELEKLIQAAEYETERVYQEVLAHGRLPDMSDSPLDAVSERMLNYLYDLKGIPFTNRMAAIQDIQSGRLVDYNVPENADYNTIATEVHREVMQLLHDRYRANQQLSDRLDSISNPLELARALGKIREKFRKREFTNRAKPRQYKTFEEAFVVGGKRPLGIGVGDAVQKYATDVMLSARTRITLNEAAQTEDADGNLLVIPDPDISTGENVDNFELLAKDTWDVLASRMASSFNYTLDPAKTSKQNVKAMIDQYIANNPRYTRVDAPFSSVPAFYAFKKPGGQENVLDALFAGGEVAGILKHVFGKPWQDSIGILRALEHANMWMKIQSLQFSLFFPLAAQESMLAILGHKYFSKDGIPSQVELRRMIKAGHPWVRDMLRKADELGLQLGSVVNPLDLPTDMISSDIDFLHDFTAKHFGDPVAKGVKSILSFSKKQTDFMFESYFNTVKLWGFLRFAHELETRAIREGREFDLKEEISPYINYLNSEIGGINWNKVSWMTPTWRRNMQLLMFSPNWSQSAINAAGFGAFTAPILKNYNTPEELRFIMRHRWPNMFLWVMVLAPAIVQAAAYTIGAALGGVGDDDEWLIFNNEEGRKLHADLTPLMRTLPWYKGAPTGERRVYIRWGKQAYETKRWLESPWNSLMSKSSQIARWAMEMATGESVGGYGWDMPFKDQGLLGWIRDKDGQFMGSRLGYTVQKFMPFSLLAWAQNPDASPFQIIGPTSKGTSFYNATQAYMGILDTWARSSTYERLYQNPRVQANLEALGWEILEASRRNGYDPKKVLKSAVGAVIKDLYANLYKAIDANDQKGIERWSRAVIRLNGTVDRALKSVKNRDNMYGTPQELSKEHEELIRAAFETP